MSRGSHSVGANLAEADVSLVAARLTELCGFRFGDVQRRSLGMAIRRRMSALDCAEGQGYCALVAPSNDAQGELSELLSEFTNTETHFFRHAGRFRLLREQVTEGLKARPRRSSEPLRVLSAGCSSGEEVYSSIITLVDVAARWQGRPLEVVGCDINRRALERARVGRYSRWSLRYTSPEILARHFHPAAGDPPVFGVKPEIQRHATFRWANLLRRDLADDPQLRGFDVILCCNVLIYMTEDAIAQMLANLRGMLADEGYLFLGYAESLQGARGEFDPVRAGDYVVYRRKGRAAASTRNDAAAARPAAWSAPVEVAAAAAGPRTSVGDRARGSEPRPAIAPSAAAVAGLAPNGPPDEPPRSGAGGGGACTLPPAGMTVAEAEVGEAPGRAYARARAQFDADQQQQALAELERLLEATPFHCGARLLRGYILGSQGAFLDAAAECTKVLDVEPYLAEAYLLRATLLRQAGDVDSAIGEAKKALYLDPNLALGQYLLARLYQQQGQHESALRAYANAARALQKHPDRPLAMHVPFELGRDALLHQIEHHLAHGHVDGNRAR